MWVSGKEVYIGKIKEGSGMYSTIVRENPEAFLSTSRTLPEDIMVSTWLSIDNKPVF